MTAGNLVEYLEAIFREYGFNEDFKPEIYKGRGGAYQVTLTKDNKAEYIDGRLYGYELLIQQVSRHNGTAENISVDISVNKYKNSIGVRIERNEKQRFNTKMGHTAISRRVEKILETWERVTNE